MSGSLPPTETPTIVSGTAPAVVVTPEPAALAPTETVTVITPQSAPVEVAEVTPVAPEPVAEPAIEPATVADETKPPTYTDKPTLLEATEGEKPGEKAPEEPKKPVEEAKKPEEAVEAVKYEPFKLPEGVKVDEDRINKFTELVGPLKLGQEDAQKLLDLHTETMDALQQHMAAEQVRVWEETQTAWLAKTMSDPVLGGAGHQTALQAAARMRDLLVPEGDRADFIDMLRVSGVGNHPALFRMLHNAARLFDEPAAPPIPARPVPDRGGNATQSRSQIMYDHPTSRRVAGGNR